ncbi:MAG: phosphoribosylformylglycinamidine synthase, partial [Chloroflexi bacterium]|nr:phosphoribosylformylglycinamidine synthase [Chloroflexota bacterium]
MQTYRVAVTTAVLPDAYGRSLTQAAHELGFTDLTACHAHRLYFLHGRLTPAAAQKLAQTLLADPVAENYTITQPFDTAQDKSPISQSFGKLRTGSPISQSPISQSPISQSPITNYQFIETVYHPGVTDPPADNLLRAARELGIAELEQAAIDWHFALEGDLPDTAVHQLAANLFANPVIQSYTVNRPVAPPFAPPQTAVDHVETIPLRQTDAAGLRQISRERRLALNLAEMQAIQNYFQAEGRDPTDVELEMLAQTWSEHCVHKTFKATIHYTGPDGETQVIDGLLNTTIRAATERINKPWVHSAFVDNAGIVAFDERYDLAFKVETHNHPSALEPFGGANTGIGGVVRDVLGVSAKPIANTDVLCFGPPDLPPEKLPHNVLHPRRVAAGVIHGIEDYGNKMGIPTVNGAIVYHEGYTANPLVYCGCLGLLPRGSHPTEPQAGDLIIALGGRTGRDGLRKATFSSMEM